VDRLHAPYSKRSARYERLPAATLTGARLPVLWR
jgi:hypothetical protein